MAKESTFFDQGTKFRQYCISEMSRTSYLILSPLRTPWLSLMRLGLLHLRPYTLLSLFVSLKRQQLLLLAKRAVSPP